jgi:3'-5' exoribonuclease
MSENKKKKVQNLTVGSAVDAPFLVMEKELREFITKEGYYLQVKLGDNTGSIWARCWEQAEAVAALFEQGDIVRVKGVVESFKGRLQVIFPPDGIAQTTKPYDITDYLPRTSKNIGRLFDALVNSAESMKNGYLKRVVFAFLNDREFVRSFKTAPAAKIHHHNYAGGLIEHTQSVVAMCETIAQLYPELDRDLLLAGAILHDIGKTATYDFTFRIEVTEEGGLVNHIVLGYQMVDEQIRRIEGFPDELRLRLLHLILSHHQQGKWGSPVKPLFAEAEALCYADLLDSQLKEFLQVQKFEAAKGKEGFWSDFSWKLDRFVYLGRDEGKGQAPGKKSEERTS